MRTRTDAPILRWTVALTALCCLAALPAAAGERLFTLDPAASDVAFALPATGHDVHGVFTVRSGNVRFDPQSGRASGTIEVDARGAETGNKSRDKTMHKEVLESEEYPLFVFTAERLDGELAPQGNSEVALVGTLRVHGADHPTTLPAKVTVDGAEVRAEVEFPVPFKEWGMHDPSFLFFRVAGVVAVTVHAVGTLTEVDAAAAGAR